MRGPEAVLLPLLPGGRVLVLLLGGGAGDDARLLHPELVHLREGRSREGGQFLNCSFVSVVILTTLFSTLLCFVYFSRRTRRGLSDLSAGLGSNEAGDGAVVVVVRPNQHPEEGRLGTAPVHRLRLAGQLQRDRTLTPGVPLCG